MSSRFKLKNRLNVVEAVGEARSSFKARYPLAGESILQEFELRISHWYGRTDPLGPTVKKEEIRQLSGKFKIGHEYIQCKVAFKIDSDVAEWQIFEYGPYTPAAQEILEDLFSGFSETAPPQE